MERANIFFIYKKIMIVKKSERANPRNNESIWYGLTCFLFGHGDAN